MSKSICIKTNNYKTIDYIINELEILNIENVFYSHKKFKNFNNIIIHYKGKEIKTILKVSQIETDRYCMISLICGILRKKYNKLASITP